MPTLVQFDFPMAGPWGDEMASGLRRPRGDHRTVTRAALEDLDRERERRNRRGHLPLRRRRLRARLRRGAHRPARGLRGEGHPGEDVPGQRAVDAGHARAGRRLRWTRRSSAGSPTADPFQVLRADARLVLRHGRAGRRLLRPYLPYFDHARTEYHRHLGTLGLTASAARSSSCAHRASSTTRRPASTTCSSASCGSSRLGRTSMTYESSPSGCPDDALMVTATQTLVLVDLEHPTADADPGGGARAGSRVRGRRPPRVSAGPGGPAVSAWRGRCPTQV